MVFYSWRFMIEFPLCIYFFYFSECVTPFNDPPYHAATPEQAQKCSINSITVSLWHIVFENHQLRMSVSRHYEQALYYKTQCKLYFISVLLKSLITNITNFRSIILSHLISFGSLIIKYHWKCLLEVQFQYYVCLLEPFCIVYS